jgi:hypothetical protein
MKKLSNISLAAILSTFLLAAGGPAANTQAPTIQIPTNTPVPAFTPTVMPAAITFVNDECIYTGPLPLPAGTEMTVEMSVKDKLPGSVPVLGVVALTLNQGMTEQDLIDNFKAADNNAAAVYKSVGAVEVLSGKSKNFSIRVPNVPIYIVCYYDPMSEHSFIIGPYEVK